MERRTNFLTFEAQSKAGVALLFSTVVSPCLAMPDPRVGLPLASAAGLVALGYGYGAWQDIENILSNKPLETEL